MDKVAEAALTRTGAGMAPTDILSGAARSAGGSPEHRCALPGYLQLPDLAMFWQCPDCGETWQVVTGRTPPGSSLEFFWVRDPIQPAGSEPAMGDTTA